MIGGHASWGCFCRAPAEVDLAGPEAGLPTSSIRSIGDARTKMEGLAHSWFYVCRVVYGRPPNRLVFSPPPWAGLQN